MNKQLTIQPRIQRILAEIKGVKAQYGITQWELDFMSDLVQRDIAFGSDKQNAVIAGIEKKVFGNEGSGTASECLDALIKWSGVNE